MNLLEDAPRLVRIRRNLNRFGYNESSFQAVCGHSESATITGVPTDWRLYTCLRLFGLGQAADREESIKYLGTTFLGDLARQQFIRIQDNAIVPLVAITPRRELLVVHDLESRRRADRVSGLNSHNDVAMVMSSPVESTLDLGAGCGIKALRAAAQSQTVTAVDKNPRALYFARVNGILNGFDNITIRNGRHFLALDLQFDQILVSVLEDQTYQGLAEVGATCPLDAQSRSLLKDIPRFLKQDGLSRMNCWWVQRDTDEWQQRLADWFQVLGCSAWVDQAEAMSPDDHIAGLMRNGRGPSSIRDASKWLERLERAGIKSIASGTVSMATAEAGKRWFRVTDAKQSATTTKLGQTTQQIMDCFDCLANNNRTADLLAQKFAAVANEANGTIDGEAPQWVQEADGQETLGSILAGVAKQTGISEEQAVRQHEPIARKLIEKGILLPNTERARGSKRRPTRKLMANVD